MDSRRIDTIFKETAYARTGGSKEELRCAKYLQSILAQMGLSAHLEPFEVEMATIQEARFLIDGKEVPCKGYLCAGNADVEAEILYLTNKDTYSLKQCKGKIVMIDSGMSHWTFQDLWENGAVGFVTYDGNVNYEDEDIDQKELRSYINNGKKLPGVNINAKTAVEIVRCQARRARIVLKQDEYQGQSHNVVLDMPGETEEIIVLNAHYDTTSLSLGAYDNMSGCIGLLGIAESFLGKTHRYSLRFLWHGSEERGLLGSKAYCIRHADELKKMVLNINMDMIGCVMGKFAAVCTAEEKLVHYVQYLASELGVGIEARDGIRSSDSTLFADNGVPAISFARYAPANTAAIHNSYDTMKVMSLCQLQKDIAFITAFTERMANAKQCPVAREIPDKMREKIDIYLCRKREK